MNTHDSRRKVALGAYDYICASKLLFDFSMPTCKYQVMYLTQNRELYDFTQQDKEALEAQSIELSHSLMKVFDSILPTTFSIEHFLHILPIKDYKGWTVDTHALEFLITCAVQSSQEAERWHKELEILTRMIARRYALAICYHEEEYIPYFVD